MHAFHTPGTPALLRFNYFNHRLHVTYIHKMSNFIIPKHIFEEKTSYIFPLRFNFYSKNSLIAFVDIVERIHEKL